MVRYAPNGYQLWDKDSKQIFIARDVKFNETYFPWTNDAENNGKLIVPLTYEQEGEEVIEEEVIEDAANVHPEEKDPDEQYGENSSTESLDCDGVQSCNDDEDAAEADDTALPSHLDLDLSSGPSGKQSRRRSERECRFPGKFLDYITEFSACAVGPPFSSDVPEMYNDSSDVRIVTDGTKRYKTN